MPRFDARGIVTDGGSGVGACADGYECCEGVGGYWRSEVIRDLIDVTVYMENEEAGTVYLFGGVLPGGAYGFKDSVKLTVCELFSGRKPRGSRGSPGRKP